MLFLPFYKLIHFDNIDYDVSTYTCTREVNYEIRTCSIFAVVCMHVHPSFWGLIVNRLYSIELAVFKMASSFAYYETIWFH